MSHITDRFFNSKWGIFSHYLYRAPACPEADKNWSRRVDSFDTDRLAANLAEMGAGYYFITIMQGTRHMIAPNKTYDEIAGTQPGEACSHRDLILDISNSLQKYGIDLYLYFTGDGPWLDDSVNRKFGFFEPRENISEEFVKKWASVTREYALRYGDRICGWWFDGCYDYFGYNNELLSHLYDAVKAGNPNTITSFNNGVDKGGKWYEKEEFTCGEFNDFTFIPKERFTDGAQTHVLIPLGLLPDGVPGGWGAKGAVRDAEYLSRYVNAVNANGGVVTIDIHIEPDGSFDPEQVAVLKEMSKNL